MFSHLPAEICVALLSIFAALALANIGLFFASRKNPGRDYGELRSRIRTWWVISGLFAGALALSPTAAVWLFALVSFLALKEFLSMAPTRRADHRVLAYAYLAIVGQYYFAASGWYGMFTMFIPVLLFVILPTRMMMTGQTESFLKAAGTLHWALMVAVFAISHAALLLMMTPGESARYVGQFSGELAADHPGIGLLVFLIVLTELNDIFQYMWGKTLGKRQVAPNISPGKTYAGAVGGIVSTVLVAGWVGPWLTLMNVTHSLCAGLIIGVAGFAGDLSLSAIKRDLKIKDFGATLPGHGGVLDRIDSLVFTAPLFSHFVLFLYG